MKDYFRNILDAINYSIHHLDLHIFDLLVNDSLQVLRNGKKIVVSGLGKNEPICEKFVGTMVSLGLSASFLNTNSAVHGDLGIVCTGDLVILLTKSGETVESIDLANLLEKRNVEVWLLTFSEESTLTKKIAKQVIVKLQHEGDMWDVMPNNSTTLNLIILQALAMQLGEKMQITLENFKKNHPGGFIGEKLQSV